jgi:hypothetical protein
MSLMDLVVPPTAPGCDRSVTDFWGWGAYGALLTLPRSRVRTRPKPSDFSGEKFQSMPSFGGEVKPSVPCRRSAVCKKTPAIYVLLHVSAKQCHPQGATVLLTEPLQRQYGRRQVIGHDGTYIPACYIANWEGTLPSEYSLYALGSVHSQFAI